MSIKILISWKNNSQNRQYFVESFEKPVISFQSPEFPT